MRRDGILFGLGAIFIVACRASVTDSSDGGGDSEITADARPPPPGRIHAGSGPGVVFAVTKLYFGDVDRSGRRDLGAWRDLGFDIDGSDTACTGKGCASWPHCRARAGAEPGVFADGNAGIDNSFGANLVIGVIHPVWAEFSDRTNEALAHGEFTLLFAIDGLGADHEYDPLLARIYRGADLGHRPALDGSDAWPVTADSLSDPTDIDSSRSVFAASWVTSDTWVSGLGEVSLHIPFLGNRLELPIHHAMVTMDLARDCTAATNGILSGILDPNELAAQAPRLAGAVDPTLCDGKGVAEVEERVLQASDILSDGRTGDSSVVCDGISIGVGFEARRVQLGPVNAVAAPVDVCAE